MEYIATFYSHFGAVRFKNELEALSINVTLMPVPRNLSSSCGTCGAFSADKLPEFTHTDEIEQLVSIEPDGSYRVIFSTL